MKATNNISGGKGSPQQQFFTKHHWLIWAIGLSIVAGLPAVWGNGLLNTRGGGDSPFLLQRVFEMEQALRMGYFPVRWMPNANYGYGYPFFNFYAPLSLYITVAFKFLGFSIVQAIKLSQVLGFVVAGCGMYELALALWQDERRAVVATAVYTFAPFHLVNVYTRGDSLAEFWAMAFYPLVILAAEQCLQKRTARSVAGLAMAYACLILSHNISALIFSPFLGLYVLGRFVSLSDKPFRALMRDWRVLVAPLLALPLALGLAAWFFVPALAEQGNAQLGPVTEGYFSYTQHFRAGAELVQSTLLFSFDPDGGTAFKMGLVQAVLGVVALLMGLWQKRWWLVLYAGGTAVIATVMITPASEWLWAQLPLLSFTQFPWRFLSVQAFGLGLLAGGVFIERWRTPFALLLSVVVAGTSLLALETDHLPISPVTAQDLAQYEWFTSNVGTTISAEYLPPTVQPRFYTGEWFTSGGRYQIKPLTGQIWSSWQGMEGRNWQWLVDVEDEGATAVLPILHWAGWQVKINDTQLPIQPADGSGLIEVTLPEGRYLLSAHLARTPLHGVAEAVSLVAFFVWLGCFFWQNIHFGKRLAWVVGGMALLGLMGAVWPTPQPTGFKTWDFDQMGYLHHEPDGVYYQNGARLQNVMVEQGSQIVVSTEWAEVTEPFMVEMALVTPAVHRQALAPEWGMVVQEVVGSAHSTSSRQATAVFTFDTPTYQGVLMPRLRVVGNQPLMPSGRTRGDLFLEPFWVQTEHPLTPINGLDLQTVAVSNDGQTLDIALNWQTDRWLTENYNVTLRLLDGNGAELAQADMQPAYGFSPSMTWQPFYPTADRLGLRLPEPTVPPYTVLARLYDVQTGGIALTRRVAVLGADWQPLEPEPPEPPAEPIGVLLGEPSILNLEGVTWQEQTEVALRFTLMWQAMGEQRGDYTRFVHLVVDPSQPPVAQADGLPVRNGYPTNQWVEGERVADPIVLDTSQLPAGRYEVWTGFYDENGRLPTNQANNGVFVGEVVIGE